MRNLESNFCRRGMSSQVEKRGLFLLAASGPLCLCATFAAVLLSRSDVLFPTIIAAFSGLFVIYFLQRIGFCLSVLLFLGAAWMQWQVLQDCSWYGLFSVTVIASWGIALLGREEIDHRLKVQQEEREISEEKGEAAQPSGYLIEKLREAEGTTSHQNIYQEKEKLHLRCRVLEGEITAYQQREKAFQTALKKSQSQVMELQQLLSLQGREVACPPLVQEKTEEREDPFSSLTTEELEHHCIQLEEELEGQEEALVQVCKELSDVECQLLLLQREREEESATPSPQEVAYQLQLQTFIEHAENWEREIALLEAIVSQLFIEKNATPSSKRSGTRAKKLPLPDLLEKAVQQKQYSLLEGI